LKCIPAPERNACAKGKPEPQRQGCSVISPHAAQYLASGLQSCLFNSSLKSAPTLTPHDLESASAALTENNVSALQVLSSMGQSSMLHVNSCRIDKGRVSRALQALQVPHAIYRAGHHLPKQRITDSNSASGHA
jgi:hypothetical protein